MFSVFVGKLAQPETGGVRTTEGEGEELETPSDDEEIKIPSQDNAGIRKVDVRNEQLENTQREDWLLPTESRHGARPRQTGAEHPPEMEDSVFRDVTIFLPSDIRMGPSVCRQEGGLIWKRTFSHPGGGGASAPRGVQEEA